MNSEILIDNDVSMEIDAIDPNKNVLKFSSDGLIYALNGGRYSFTLKINNIIVGSYTIVVQRNAESILVDGDFVNYDGKTDITTSSRNTYLQNKIVCGRAKGWEEKDFSTDISGESYMPVAQEVAEYWQGVDMQDILAILKGIFSMTDTAGKEFVEKHTYEKETKIETLT